MLEDPYSSSSLKDTSLCFKMFHFYYFYRYFVIIYLNLMKDSKTLSKSTKSATHFKKHYEPFTITVDCVPW